MRYRHQPNIYFRVIATALLITFFPVCAIPATGMPARQNCLAPSVRIQQTPLKQHLSDRDAARTIALQPSVPPLSLDTIVSLRQQYTDTIAQLLLAIQISNNRAQYLLTQDESEDFIIIDPAVAAPILEYLQEDLLARKAPASPAALYRMLLSRVLLLKHLASAEPEVTFLYDQRAHTESAHFVAGARGSNATAAQLLSTALAPLESGAIHVPFSQFTTEAPETQIAFTYGTLSSATLNRLGPAVVVEDITDQLNRQEALLNLIEIHSHQDTYIQKKLPSSLIETLGGAAPPSVNFSLTPNLPQAAVMAAPVVISQPSTDRNLPAHVLPPYQPENLEADIRNLQQIIAAITAEVPETITPALRSGERIEPPIVSNYLNGKETDGQWTITPTAKLTASEWDLLREELREIADTATNVARAQNINPFTPFLAEILQQVAAIHPQDVLIPDLPLPADKHRETLLEIAGWVSALLYFEQSVTTEPAAKANSAAAETLTKRMSEGRQLIMEATLAHLPTKLGELPSATYMSFLEQNELPADLLPRNMIFQVNADTGGLSIVDHATGLTHNLTPFFFMLAPEELSLTSIGMLLMILGGPGGLQEKALRIIAARSCSPEEALFRAAQPFINQALLAPIPDGLTPDEHLRKFLDVESFIRELAAPERIELPEHLPEQFILLTPEITLRQLLEIKKLPGVRGIITASQLTHVAIAAANDNFPMWGNARLVEINGRLFPLEEVFSAITKKIPAPVVVIAPPKMIPALHPRAEHKSSTAIFFAPRFLLEQAHRQKIADLAQQHYIAARWQLPITLPGGDGRRIDVSRALAINTDGIADTSLPPNQVAVGLTRTENYYARAGKDEITESEWENIFRALLQHHPEITIRIPDPEPDKPVGKSKATGLDFSLHDEAGRQISKSIIRAAFRTALNQGARIKLIFPLIRTHQEWTSAEQLYQEALKENPELLRYAQDTTRARQILALGMMFETPQAVENSGWFMQHIDCASIGTNDLIHFTQGIERGDSRMTTMDPRTRSQLETLIAAAQKYGVPLTCCGELAAQPAFLLFFAYQTISRQDMPRLPIYPSIGAGQLAFAREFLRHIDADALQKFFPGPDNQEAIEDEIARIMQEIADASEPYRRTLSETILSLTNPEQPETIRQHPVPAPTADAAAAAI